MSGASFPLRARDWHQARDGLSFECIVLHFMLLEQQPSPAVPLFALCKTCSSPILIAELKTAKEVGKGCYSRPLALFAQVLMHTQAAAAAVKSAIYSKR